MSEQSKIPDSVKADDMPARRVPPKTALTRLIDGNARYAANQSQQQRDYSVGRAERAAAQYPFAAILSCADSRVAPELAFDQGPGDLFVVRLAGNFVNSDGLASLEYAVEFLSVGLIVVLGHGNCGAVAAAIKVIREDVQLPGELPCLVQNIKPNVRAVVESSADPDTVLDAAIAHNVRENVRRLRQAEPLLAARIASGEIDVVGAVYDLHSGKITLID